MSRPWLLAALAAGAPIACVAATIAATATLRGARATIATDASQSIAGAALSYTVDGATARLTLAKDDGYELKEGGFHLVDVTGIGYPLLLVEGVICGRDCEEAPRFFRFSLAGPSLAEVPEYAVDDDSYGKALGPCFAVANPQLLYSWDYESAIPIRDAVHRRYYAARMDSGALAIVEARVVYRLGSDAPHRATPAPTPPLAGMRVRRTSTNGTIALSPC